MSPCKTIGLVLVLLFAVSPFAWGQELSPQNFTSELKGGFWLPQQTTVKNYLGEWDNPLIKFECGVLWRSKLGFEMGVGALRDKGLALGATSGTASQDSYSFYLVPLQNNVSLRADFQENQILVPYVKLGTDYVYYRDSLRGSTTQGIKYGFHGTVGLQILMEWFEDSAHALEEEGLNDIYLTLEGQYALIDNFTKGSGLDLSGWSTTAGLLFEF